ncbi:exportin-1-like [Dorcoceras hygrometricum]|uniref:Exportin-1-like n=1 Tax=Dorcoceras hygrometricum TaxID=472368 RepID=A0A2Z7CAK6_9LAMI|nr:exportin-1-like [Dorcoceras hygrometricum]
MRIRPPELETSICDVKYHVSLVAGLGEVPMHVGVDASLSRIHRSLSCVDILCYLFWGSGSAPRRGSGRTKNKQPGDNQYEKSITVIDIHRGNLESSTCVILNGSGIQLAVGPQPLWLRNHNSGLAQRIMVKRLATSPHDPLGITDSACKKQLVVVSVQYGPFNPYIPIRSTTIGKSRVAIDPIAMHTSWRSNSDIASVTRQTHLPKTLVVLWPEICTLLSPQIAYDIHACLRAVNPRQRCIDSYMHRGLTQSQRLVTPSESANGSK